MEKDVYYFSHDANARHDPKILALRSIYGCEGYGWFWIILEMLREDSLFRFPLNKFQLMALAKELETNLEMLQKFLSDCYEIGLFYVEKDEKNNQYLVCDSLNQRMSKYLEQKEVRSKAGKLGADARWQTHDNRMRLTRQKMPKKGKESKVKESKVKESKWFKKPSVSEIAEYCLLRKNGIDPQYFFDSNESKGWVVGKNKSPMKDWKATIRTWESFNKNKKGESNGVIAGLHEIK